MDLLSTLSTAPCGVSCFVDRWTVEYWSSPIAQQRVTVGSSARRVKDGLGLEDCVQQKPSRSRRRQGAFGARRRPKEGWTSSGRTGTVEIDRRREGGFDARRRCWGLMERVGTVHRVSISSFPSTLARSSPVVNIARLAR